MSLTVYLPYTPRNDSLQALQSALDERLRLVVGDMPPSPDYHILVNGRPTRAELEASPNLQALIIPFAGLPATTHDLMRDYSHIAIHNLHHNATPTAEMALALLLAAARRIIPADRDFRRHDWRPRYEPYPSALLHGKRALILGYGAIGQHVGTVLQAMGMDVIGIRRRHIDPDNNVYPLDKLHDLLPTAHVLMIALPGTPDTKGLINTRELDLLPPGAIVVNVGRAAVIDQHALYEALKSGHLHGAGQDVWYHYPQSEADRNHTPPADVPFHELDNMVMSPHRAGGGGNDEIETLRMSALADLLNYAARGEAMPHRVDLQLGY